MNNGYLEVISLVERLHRHFLEVVKLELDGLGIHDINNVQGLMLFNIGDAEMTVGELTLRGCYLGSNVSYNVKKMVENGYLSQTRSVHDRRSIHVRLTDKGRKLRDRLNDRLHKGLDEIYINGSEEHRLPHNLNISFAYVEGESLLMGINDVAVSSGSACTSASLEPSYVLKALGAGDDLAHSSIRFGLGRWSTEEEVDYVADKLINVVTRLREMSPLYELAKEGVDLSTMQWQTEGH